MMGLTEYAERDAMGLAELVRGGGGLGRGGRRGRTYRRQGVESAAQRRHQRHGG